MATIEHELALLFLEYAKTLDKRVKVLEEELNRYDF